MKNILGVLLLLVVSCASQEIRRPTTESSSGLNSYCGGDVFDAASNFPLGIDSSGLGTSSNWSTSGQLGGAQGEEDNDVMSAFPAASAPYSSLSLNVNSSCVKTRGPAACSVFYSLDGGSTWNAIRSGQWAQTTNTVAIPASSLPSLKVLFCQVAQDGSTFSTNGLIKLTVWDVWTSGTTIARGRRWRVSTE